MITKLALRLLIMSVLVLSFVSISHAITIGFNPVSQDVVPGNTVEVGIFISGLGNFSSPSLGTFDLDIGFDPTIVGFKSVTFGDPVLGDQLDVFGLGSITSYSNTIPGIINIFELSLDLPDDLNTYQTGSFTLASLTFNAISPGYSSLDLSINALGDSWGDFLTAEVQGGGVSVVPEPSTFLLVCCGLVALGCRIMKRRFGDGP